MSGRGDVVDLIRACKGALASNASELVLDMSDAERVYPNGCVPMAAIVQYYKSIDLRIRIANESFLVSRSHFRNPLEATKENLSAAEDRLSVLWVYFNYEQCFDLANCLIEELSERVEFGEGVLPALNWCLFEVLDNVFEHARSDVGYVMAQVLRNSKRLLVCVADTGIGIHRSFLLGGHYRPPNVLDSLTLAVRKGVTSTGDRRGNGLYGLRGVVEANGGRLELTSGRGALNLSGTVSLRRLGNGIVLDEDHHCTVVDFQLDVSRPVSLNEVLGMPIIDTRLERIENDAGQHVIAIRDYAQGTGTRAAAERLRNFLVNYLSEGAPSLLLDFDGVDMVSSSFADETIGKLAEKFGPVGFFQRFRLVNMSPTVQGLLDRAIGLRLSDTYFRDDKSE